ncbi:MAG: hypothetical protein M3434_06900 [Gemmatimonadota bacterium]|nr:hypothetical protein [Gemmatimonadota bacterium]
MPRCLRTAVLTLLCIVPLSSAATQQRPRTDSVFTVEKYFDYETVADPQISPNGAEIVYTRRWINWRTGGTPRCGS